jgi:uncharacterized phage-like protein YoqJ
VRTFFTGGALGFDTLAARQVILFKMSHPDIQLHLIAPCITQADNWTRRQRDAYEFVLRNADHVEYVSDEYTRTCMQIRNQRLANECDMLVVYMSRYNTGTGQTVRMAEKMGKTIFNLYPTLQKSADIKVPY